MTRAQAALLAIVLLAACGGGGTSATTATTAGPTTIAAAARPTTSTASSAVSLIPQTSPDVAAVALLNAWRAGDRVAAARVATPDAVASLFAQPPQSFSARGCQDPIGGRSACSFGVGGGVVDLNTVTIAGGWVTDSVVFL